MAIDGINVARQSCRKSQVINTTRSSATTSVVTISFNDTVMKYNTAIQTFPAVLLAGAMGFKERPNFAADEGASTAPKVTF